jgi:4-amino-4-deoxy-L-arabinose transferase-like glycosyltransferase
MKNRKNICIFHLLILVFLTGLFFFYALGSYSLKEPDEGRYAEIPREMVKQGDYLVPHLNYVRYFEKPPLLYWGTALSYKLFGTNEWSFRLPNAMMALLCVIILYLFAKVWFDNRTAFLSSLILMSSFGFFAMAHIVTIDMLFAVLLCSALLCFYEYYRRQRHLFLYLFYLSLALATLAKGPVSLILMGATILFFLVTEKRLTFIRQLLDVRALLLFALITIPWFLIISLKEKEFFHFFFIDQHLLRFLTTKHKRSGPLYYFIPVILGGMFPWCIFLPRAIMDLWRTRALRLFFIWSMVVFVFFSISDSKLPPYVLPVFPAFSLILGYFFARTERWEIPPLLERRIFYGILFLIAIGTFLHTSGLLDASISKMSKIGDVVVQFKSLSLSLFLVSVLLVSIGFLKRFQTVPLFVLVLLFSFSTEFLILLNISRIDGLNTTKSLSRTINEHSSGDDYVVSYGSYNETLPFYIGRRVYLAAHTGELEMGSQYPEAKPFFLTDEDFQRLFQSEKRVFAVLKAKKLSAFRQSLANNMHILRCDEGRCLITNKDNYERCKE